MTIDKLPGHFVIAGGELFAGVFWQVTRMRQDKWAEANRIPVEQNKPDHEKSLYIHPELHNLGIDNSIN